MISKYDSDWVDGIIRDYKPFKENLPKMLSHFPKDLECPEDIKRWICGLAGSKESLETTLTLPRDRYSGASIREVIERKDYQDLREYLVFSYQLMICGPSSQ
ncbi:MAG: hypothetical protein COV44_09500 [Deltaproteobacteria bacterium CG11_big_fil_rev_8_21_14_0_20_45_16]|nr:MAG: hypothetical protein COV44_09500 [Deltaproteobacteria bacterium CG11_big_fil_rev_8_21_14_0_20_45_16]